MVGIRKLKHAVSRVLIEGVENIDDVIDGLEYEDIDDFKNDDLALVLAQLGHSRLAAEFRAWEAFALGKAGIA